MEKSISPRQTWRLFMIFAWLCPLLPSLVMVIFWSGYIEKHIDAAPPNPNQPRQQFRSEKQKESSDGMTMALIASGVGCLFGIISLCGIRSLRGALVIIPGALVGFLISGVALVLAFMLVWVTNFSV